MRAILAGTGLPQKPGPSSLAANRVEARARIERRASEESMCVDLVFGVFGATGARRPRDRIACGRQQHSFAFEPGQP